MTFPLVPLSKTGAEFSLSAGELGLVIFAAILVAGTIGEQLSITVVIFV